MPEGGVAGRTAAVTDRRDASDSKFSVVPPGRRIWAVAAIHGELALLQGLHAQLAPKLRSGDALVYLGNILGRGGAIVATIDEVLRFRRIFLARPQAFAADISVLRGVQEEMWGKLLQIQFATNPREVLEWMGGQGIGATIQAYGGELKDGLIAAKGGAMALFRWTNHLRQAMQRAPGHAALMSALRHAAYDRDHGLLLVHAGIDPARPFSEQGDSFWWGGRDFDRLETGTLGFTRIARGYDPAHKGERLDPVAATLDGGAGFGGPLVAVCFENGQPVDRIEVRP